MAHNLFIKIGDIRGDCTAENHEGQIQVLSWNHSFNQPTSPVPSKDGTVEQATHADFSFTKYIDSASTSLLKYNWSGKRINRVVFTANRSYNDKIVKYLEITMDNVIISNISIGGGTGDVPTETVTLCYGAVNYTYFQQKTEAGKLTAFGTQHDLVKQIVS